MPVTVIPAAHQPKAHPTIQHVESLDRFLQFSCPDSYITGETRILGSSFDRPAPSGASSNELYPSSSSFVRSAIEAWGNHSHLVLRPDDVWFTILVQMNFFMEKNAESLRHIFVAHEGKERLEVWDNGWGRVVDQFNDLLQRNIKTPWMSDWRLLSKTKRLEDFGIEPSAYACRLRPILSRIVATFDSPAAPHTRDFWDQLVQAKVKHTHICGQPPTQYIVSGWILGFFYWDSTGYVSRRFSEGWTQKADPNLLVYDSVQYGEAALEDLPIGYAKAAFEMMSESSGPAGGPLKGWILAGNIGKSIVGGAPEGYRAALASQSDPDNVDIAKDEPDRSGCFSGLLRGLGCFGGKHKDAPEPVQTMSEKQAPQASMAKIDFEDGHSTIQPRSGSFLFGPEKDTGPFFDTEEIDGPTVDAIDSCTAGNVKDQSEHAQLAETLNRTTNDVTTSGQTPQRSLSAKMRAHWAEKEKRSESNA
ncbi:hypothetical protein LTR85_003339 [Meristemomyces frigidus]|nr:hypothetical protein LTR85_003339 [Meristemomyces frigidus]